MWKEIFDEAYVKLAKKLTYRERQQLPDSAFAIPEERRYPIMDRAHAKNALARVAQFGTPEERQRVREAVYRRYPDLKEQREEKIGRPMSRRELKEKKKLPKK